MDTSNLQWHLAIWRIPGIGPVQFTKISEKYANIAEYFLENPSKKTLINWQAIENDLMWAESADCFIFLKSDKAYPARLKEISCAPPILFVQGDPSILASFQIAIVGSRHPTPGGIDTAYQFSKVFTQSKLTITSGLALGIDGASHQGALDAGGRTIAVMGTGPDQIYPKRHQALASAIIENGCLVTEFPTGVMPASANFPRRNRLISGLSLGVLVVEAAFASGSLLTAKYALEQNREVFAIPGAIQNPLARGCHALIKQGAKLVETAQEVLEEINTYPDAYSPAFHSPVSTETSLQNKNPFLNFIGYETTSIDLIIQRSALTAEKVSSMLLILELEGYIASVPGGYLRLN